ncbi:DUF120 domain-containing protein [Aliiruegeria sabulilitoris]|uniref:DUF120 domain-containing protein n=1 Tax=Aliiruegeria sabulilitoris TaxID=1510458 RepID=UPI00082F36E3|nr:DUF120 domain-containing protein [Aliiruegeria sabulilitoris]NDR57921.1 DUF120 domain-containing protein [Pseudoruegeria sp. M32A2M]
MSYMTLATNKFEQVASFYGSALGFPVIEKWDQPTSRGIRFDLGGVHLEIIDSGREANPLMHAGAVESLQVVVEVDDIEEMHHRIAAEVPPPATVPWGARLFRLNDPDGIPVTFLQWLQPTSAPLTTIRGTISSGLGRGQYFTQLVWVRSQLIESLGFDPFPGTFNLVPIDLVDVVTWIRLRGTPGVRIKNPGNGTNDHDARCYPVTVDHLVDAVIVLPEVGSYPEAQIEIIAPVCLREQLGKGDGECVVIEFTVAEPD